MSVNASLFPLPPPTPFLEALNSPVSLMPVPLSLPLPLPLPKKRARDQEGLESAYSLQMAKKEKTSHPDCITRWIEMAGEKELEERRSYLINLVESGELESLQRISTEKTAEFDACLEETKLLDRIKKLRVLAVKVDACCHFLLTKGADYSNFKMLFFIQHGCHESVKAILKQMDPYQNLQMDVIRALLYPDAEFNIDILLKWLASDKSLCTAKTLTDVTRAILSVCAVKISAEERERFLNSAHSFMTEVLKIYRDFELPLDMGSLLSIIGYNANWQEREKFVKEGQKKLLDAFLPHFFMEPSFSHNFSEIKDKLIFIKIIAKSKLAYSQFKEFHRQFLSEDQNILNTINWMHDFISLKCRMRKSFIGFEEELVDLQYAEEMKLDLYLSYVLDSLQKGIPYEFQVLSDPEVLKFYMDVLLLFRIHLLNKNITKYDELLKRMIEENLFAFQLVYTLPNDGISFKKMAEQVVEKLKGLPPIQAEDPLIPKGFLPSCFMMRGGYLSEKLDVGHGVVFVIDKNSDGTFNFTIVNTGEESPSEEDSDKVYDIKYSNVDPKELTVSFIQQLLFYAVVRSDMDDMDVLLDFIDGHLKQHSTKGKGRIHNKGHGKGNCVAKAQCAYTKHRLLHSSDPLALQFKAFYTEKLVRDFDGLRKKFIKNYEDHPFLKKIGNFRETAKWLNTMASEGERVLVKRKAKAESFAKEACENGEKPSLSLEEDL